MNKSLPIRPILVSACLLGLATRYDGRRKTNRQVLTFLQRDNLLPVPICPEQLAGMSTPRPASCFHRGDGDDILDGRGELVNAEGVNVNARFLKGARETLKIARLSGCGGALLKERSPSCGVHQVYLHTRITRGSGVAAALLRRSGLQILSDEDIENSSPSAGFFPQ